MENKEGINVDNITFDANGEALGLDDDTLNTVSAGKLAAIDDINGYCPVSNTNC